MQQGIKKKVVLHSRIYEISTHLVESVEDGKRLLFGAFTHKVIPARPSGSIMHLEKSGSIPCLPKVHRT